MRGLLEKDLRLITYRKKYYLIFLVIAIFFSLKMEGTFVVSYLALAGMALSLSSVSYDEFDNGYAFLMTLPATRKQFALEKNLFGCITITVFWLIGVVLQLLSGLLRPELPALRFMLPGMLVGLGTIIIVMSILMPIEIHFGSEKSRIVLMVLFGLCFAVGMLGEKITAVTHLSPDSIAEALSSIPLTTSVTCGALIVLLVFAVSTFITMRIMDKKEF